MFIALLALVIALGALFGDEMKPSHVIWKMGGTITITAPEGDYNYPRCGWKIREQQTQYCNAAFI